ncbi:MAG: restriction endonuclease subunit S [Lactococcus raffinolactis]|jgi:type I restriction enzyme S subunit|nr:restriction endonuclease subunit S [Lactococcus raffinolactis]
MGDQNKNVPRLRFPGYTDAWVKCTLGDVLNYEQPTKYIVDSADYNDANPIPVLTAGQSFILGYTDEKSGIKVATPLVPVIIFDDFTTSSHYVDFSFKVKSSAMKLLGLKKENYDFYFIFNVLKNINYIPESHERHWISKFSKLQVMLPNIKEQIKIGKFFKHLDNLITVNERELNKLKDLKKSYLEKMFPKNGSDIPELRFPGYADAWVKCELGEVANYRNGRAHEQSISDDGEYVVINSKFVSTSGLVRKYSMVQNEPLRNGEIVFVLSDVPNGKALARTFLVTEDNKYTLNQRIAGITPFENIDSYFLYFLMNRHPYFTQFDDGVGQTNLSKNDVENFEESYPSGEEQAKIGEFFKHLDDLITVNERELNKLKELKKSYLKDMFV